MQLKIIRSTLNLDNKLSNRRTKVLLIRRLVFLSIPLPSSMRDHPFIGSVPLCLHFDWPLDPCGSFAVFGPRLEPESAERPEVSIELTPVLPGLE